MGFLIFNLVLGMVNFGLLNLAARCSAHEVGSVTIEVAMNAVDDLQLSEETTNKIKNFIGNLLESPVATYTFVYLFVSIPVINIIFLAWVIVDVIKSFKK